MKDFETGMKVQAFALIAFIAVLVGIGFVPAVSDKIVSETANLSAFARSLAK